MTWKLWTEPANVKSCVYLACRSLGGSLKVSLHQSGEWHYAYSVQTFEDQVKGIIATARNRFIETWQRPPELGSGTTLALRILTPSSAVTTPVNASFTSPITWLPNAPANKATEVDILITSASARVSGWPGKRAMRTCLIGSIPLENGETVWAVYHVVLMPDFSKILPSGIAGFYKGATKEDLNGGGIRALAFGKEPDGSRVLYDCAVEVKQVRKPG